MKASDDGYGSFANCHWYGRHMQERIRCCLAVVALLWVRVALPGSGAAAVSTWTPDNGDGTFTNPLFYDEFSDPDLIRVGDDFYLTGTTMHSMPGLPILRSRDLVNWTFVAYAMETLDLGPGFRLEQGKNVYGQGIWAPSLRHHAGTFYLFSNVNGHTTQLFTAKDPAGPWTHRPMKRSFHDLSVLFDGGKVYVVWGYQGIRFAQLNDALDDVVPGTEREIIPKSAGMGEGLHFYKFGDKYFVTSAWYEGRMRMPAARADRPDGPYEVNPAISIDEDFGMAEGNRLNDVWGRKRPLEIRPGNPQSTGRLSLHQGGIVDTPSGEWWGFSMMDYNSVGRLTALSPITWKDGWPYFGLPGNHARNPRTWVKPTTAQPQPVTVPFERNDDFAGATLKPVWQWNHVPVRENWSLEERKGFLRLRAMPATSLWDARNTLTQRSIGPRSTPTAVLDASGMANGDVAGLALFNLPHAWVGVERSSGGLTVAQFDELTQRTTRKFLGSARVWLRAPSDFMAERAHFEFSTDGKKFEKLGEPFTMVFQLATFQGVRFALFAFNREGRSGGRADFDTFTVDQPHPRGLLRPIPFGDDVVMTPAGKTSGVPGRVTVRDRKLGRVALGIDGRWLSVADDGSVTRSAGEPATAETFQWMETPTGDLVLMSLRTNRFLRADPSTNRMTADSPGPVPDGSDGVRFQWRPAD
jgi:xylan 1,4-beta-xylosidase